MGILDDAIREHLELKRQHGAGSDDLDRLESEAFGPATRPGDPDFEAPETDGGKGDAATAVAPDQDLFTAVPAEVARTEHPHLVDTADHPAPDPPPVEALREPEPPAPSEGAPPEAPPLQEPLPPGPPQLSEPTPEPPPATEPPEPPESSIFDGDDIDFGDLDLDLDEEDDGTAGPQPAATEEPSPFLSEEEDLSLAFEDEIPPTGEQPLPPRADVLRDSAVEEDTGSAPLPVPPLREEEPDLDSEDPPAPAEDGSAAPARPAEGEPGGEDLLEETPDFLRDTPEGDRAWFEQDPPKDFDFDD